MAIVCGTDLSELSLEALAAAIAIATRRGDTTLALVNVIASDAVRGDHAAEQRLVEAAQSRLGADAARLSAGTTMAIRTEVLVGDAVSTLLAFAETEGADLVVISSKGTTNSPTYKLGGTSERIAQEATMPVLVVRDSAPLIAWARDEKPLSVLVGVDDSASCEPALRWVKALRAAGPTDIILGNVYYADEAARRYGLRTHSMVETDPEVEQLLARDMIARFGEVGGVGALKVKPTRGLGRIGDHLLELADAEDVDVIVVGTRHKAGLGRLSSVSSVVLHDADQSVLCIPPTWRSGIADVPRFRVAVVATDLSDFGNRAVPHGYGVVMASGARAEVHLVTVVEPHDPETDIAERHAQLLALTPPAAAAVGVTTHAQVVRSDDTARALCEAAERVGADVIVIATHGRGGLSRALVGSVADKVIRGSRRPVLVLRPPLE